MKRAIVFVILLLLMALLLLFRFKFLSQESGERRTDTAPSAVSTQASEAEDTAFTESDDASPEEGYVQQEEFNASEPDVPEADVVEEYVVKLQEGQVFTIN